jgi:hypothetical protein
MKNDAIRSKEEAHELVRRLAQFYGEPVLPLGNFCHAIELWMDCIVKNNTDPALNRDGIKHGSIYFEFLNLMRIDIRKSNLLGRLLFAKEPLRTQMCSTHKGHFNAEAMFFEKCPLLCDGTGWLRERPQDGGYTGIQIVEVEGRTEDGKLKFKDPETGKWETAE